MPPRARARVSLSRARIRALHTRIDDVIYRIPHTRALMSTANALPSSTSRGFMDREIARNAISRDQCADAIDLNRSHLFPSFTCFHDSNNNNKCAPVRKASDCRYPGSLVITLEPIDFADDGKVMLEQICHRRGSFRPSIYPRNHGSRSRIRFLGEICSAETVLYESRVWHNSLRFPKTPLRRIRNADSDEIRARFCCWSSRR